MIDTVELLVAGLQCVTTAGIVALSYRAGRWMATTDKRLDALESSTARIADAVTVQNGRLDVVERGQAVIQQHCADMHMDERRKWIPA